MFSLALRTLYGSYLCGLLLVTGCSTEDKANPTDHAGDRDSNLGGNSGTNASQRTNAKGGANAASSRSGATLGSASASRESGQPSQSTLTNNGAGSSGSGGATGDRQSGGATPMGGSTALRSGARSNGGSSSAVSGVASSKAKGGAASTSKDNGGASQGGAASTRASSTGGPGEGGTHTNEPSTAGRPRVTAASGATLVKVDAATKYQTFEGWGASLCWWAYQLGGWSAAKRDQFLELVVNPTTGLGYNIFRYNIGGGDAPSHSHMGTNREMPGFQASTGAWDWNADARQTSVLNRLVKTAKDVIVEAFSNSPPYWMTKSGCASGNTDGSNNLKDDSYGAFADYLTEVVKHYRDELGITFRTLEPMNEPNANWWKSNGGQEGCHFGGSSQQQLIKAVGAALATKGLTETQISASDENSMDDAYSIMSGYDAATLGYLSQMNVHSYAGSRRTQLRTLATSKGKRLWQSESGPLSVTLDTNLDAAIFMAGRIIMDLRELKPEAWIEWQLVDPALAWTSFSVNDAKETWTPVKRFYAQAAFSRFIRPGATFVSIDNADMVAAVAGDGSALTVVVRNGDQSKPKSFTFDLTSLPSLGSSINVYRTSATEDLAALPPVAVKDWSFTASAPAYSITTYVIPLSAAASGG